MDYREPGYRRRAPRVHTAGWSGKCIVEDDPEAGWSECRLLDVSLLGLGLELLGDVPHDVIGRRLVVDVDVGESISIRLVGLIRRLGPGHPGWTRAGLDFEGLCESEQSVLKVIDYLKIGW